MTEDIGRPPRAVIRKFVRCGGGLHWLHWADGPGVALHLHRHALTLKGVRHGQNA